jgi:hypothetical protein
VGFLGVAGIAIIALYVYAQGRRGRAKERAEAERPSAEPAAASSERAEPASTTQHTGADGE